MHCNRQDEKKSNTRESRSPNKQEMRCLAQICDVISAEAWTIQNHNPNKIPFDHVGVKSENLTCQLKGNSNLSGSGPINALADHVTNSGSRISSMIMYALAFITTSTVTSLKNGGYLNLRKLDPNVWSILV